MDERHRQLERFARENPNDRDAGWALARALELRGDRRAQFLELARLARVGDPDAARAVTLWSPLCQRHGAARSRLAIAAEPSRRALGLGFPIFAATDGALIGLDGEQVRAARSTDGEPLWSARLETTIVDVATRGDDVVAAGERALFLLDGASGERLATAEVAGAGAVVRRMIVSGDRALLRLRHDPAVYEYVGVDLRERFGAALGRSTPLERWGISPLSTSAVLGSRAEGERLVDLAALAIEDGAILWRAVIDPPWRLVAQDARGAALRRRGDATVDVLLELDARAGSARELNLARGVGRRMLEDRIAIATRDLLMERPHEVAPVALDDLVAIAERTGYARGTTFRELVALDRASGEVAWSRPMPERRTRALAIGGGLVYVVWTEERKLRLAGLALQTGEAQFELELADYDPEDVALLPMQRAVIARLGTGAIRVGE